MGATKMYVTGRSAGASESPTVTPALYQLASGGFMAGAKVVLTGAARISFLAADGEIDRVLGQLAGRGGSEDRTFTEVTSP